MRAGIFFAAAALATGAGCDSKALSAPEAFGPALSAAGCIAPTRREVGLTAPAARDVLSAEVIGADCASASLVFSLHKADGTLLWTFSVRTGDTWAFVPAEDDKPLDPQRAMEAFLASVFANVRLETSDAAPDWPEAAPRPEDPSGLFHLSPLSREAYLSLRSRKVPVLCIQAEMGTSHCIAYDPAFGDTASEYYASSS